jgi:uncharacterized membrane protein HdeD (DUF308 family)
MMNAEGKNAATVEPADESDREATRLRAALTHELRHARDKWWWAVLLGVGLFVLGIFAIGSAIFVSAAAVVLFGVLLLMGGVGQLISAFWAGKWSGFLLQLLIGILYIVVGILIVDAPMETAVALTLLIAAFLIVVGIFRIVASMVLQFPGWGWQLLNGLVTLLLGVLILKGWPATGFVIIGLFIGIEMMFNGLSWAMLGLEIRRLPEELVEEEEAEE